MSVGRYRRRSLHSGHTATIQVSGIVPTGAGIVSAQPLHRMAKSQSRWAGHFVVLRISGTPTRFLLTSRNMGANLPTRAVGRVLDHWPPVLSARVLLSTLPSFTFITFKLRLPRSTRHLPPPCRAAFILRYWEQGNKDSRKAPSGATIVECFSANCRCQSSLVNLQLAR